MNQKLVLWVMREQRGDKGEITESGETEGDPKVIDEPKETLWHKD